MVLPPPPLLPLELLVVLFELLVLSALGGKGANPQPLAIGPAELGPGLGEGREEEAGGGGAPLITPTAAAAAAEVAEAAAEAEAAGAEGVGGVRLYCESIGEGEEEAVETEDGEGPCKGLDGRGSGANRPLMRSRRLACSLRDVTR